MAELALDDVQRHALAGQLDGVDVPERVRREARGDAGRGGEPAQLPAHAGLRPGPPAGRAGDDAEQWTGRKLEPLRAPGTEVLPAPVVHAHLAPAVALAAADKQRAAARVEIALVEVERLLDPQARAPEHDDQRPHPLARETVAGLAHHGQDLLDPGRVGRVVHALVPRATAAMELREG